MAARAKKKSHIAHLNACDMLSCKSVFRRHSKFEQNVWLNKNRTVNFKLTNKKPHHISDSNSDFSFQWITKGKLNKLAKIIKCDQYSYEMCVYCAHIYFAHRWKHIKCCTKWALQLPLLWLKLSLTRWRPCPLKMSNNSQ